MESYHSQFQKAVRRNKIFGLNIPSSIQKFDMDESRYIDENLLRSFPDIMEDSAGMLDPRAIAANCFKIHMDTQEALEAHLGISLAYTLGYVTIQGQNVHYQSEESLRAMLENPTSDSTVNLHAWLTLPSMEIIDLTFLTTFGLVKGREDLIGGVVAKLADEPEPPIFYRPMLLGDEFLFRSGMVKSIVFS